MFGHLIVAATRSTVIRHNMTQRPHLAILGHAIVSRLQPIVDCRVSNIAQAAPPLYNESDTCGWSFTVRNVMTWVSDLNLEHA
jgi:hypothetical protein